MKKLLERRTAINIEMRALQERVHAGGIKAADAIKQLKALSARKAALEKEIALAKAPVENRTSSSLADVAKAMREKRAITMNGTGAINQIKEMVKEMQTKTPILEKVRYFYGPNAATNIPIWTPTIANPGNYAEGVTNVTNDTQAVLGNQSLTPYAYVSILPVSAEAISLGSVNIEAELQTIFADAFAHTFHSGILTGNGTGRNFKGIFPAITTGSKITCAAAGMPKIGDLVKLALTIQDMTDDGVVIMSPSIYSLIIADATTGVADVYKEELIKNKKIEGVPILLTSDAPSSVSSGSVVAVAGKLEKYAVAIAAELNIEPIKQLGDTNTYFQATSFANGKPIIEKDFYGLTTL
jgi:HK97 family phage major capsid protein